jgi:hypothetical protein
MNKYASASGDGTSNEANMESTQQVEREGRRVLRKLSEAGLFLAPDASGQYALAGSRRAGKLMRVSAVVVEAFRRRGWLSPRGTKPETFAISDVGAGWIARELAVDDPSPRSIASLERG